MALKYKFAKEVAKELVYCTLEFLKNESLVLPKEDVLVPIPLYWFRGNWRGFNQSDEIGKTLARGIGLGFIPDLLIRKKFTKPQTELKGKERRENVRGVFSLNPNYKLQITKYNSLILFDDVWTTGATIKEATKVLKRAGANKVWALTLART